MKCYFLTVPLCALVLSCGVANAADAQDATKPTALLVGGQGSYATLTDEQMRTVLNGYFADYTRINVPFPGDGNDFSYSISEGAKALLAEVNTVRPGVEATGGHITIGGASEGAPVVFEVLRQLQADPGRPPKSELDAIVYGAPGPIFYVGGPAYKPVPVTQYDLKVVIAEYDGIADAPDNWLNLLAVANAIMGAEQYHTSAAFTSDLSQVPAQDITIVKNRLGGVTTTYVVPTAVLPILKPLIDKGVPESQIEALDKVLRPIIDSAYVRTWTGHKIVQASAAAPSSAPNAAAAVTTEAGPAVKRPVVAKVAATAAAQGQPHAAGATDAKAPKAVKAKKADAPKSHKAAARHRR